MGGVSMSLGRPHIGIISNLEDSEILHRDFSHDGLIGVRLLRGPCRTWRDRDTRVYLDVSWRRKNFYNDMRIKLFYNGGQKCFLEVK